FRALLEDHGHELDAMAAVVGRAGSFSELVRGVVAVWVDHYRSDALFAPLALESRAYAMREPRARAIVGEFYAQMRQLIAGMLRAGQDAGFVRRDLDVVAASSLLFGVLDGTCMQAAMDPERVPLAGLEDRIADLAERHVRSKGAGSLARLRASVAPLVEHSALRGDTVPRSSSRSTRRRRQL